MRLLRTAHFFYESFKNLSIIVGLDTAHWLVDLHLAVEYKRAKPNPCVVCEVSGVCIHSAILVTCRTILPKLALDSMYSCAACACSSPC